jgi:uncharacterized protein
MDSKLLDILCCPITLKPLHSVSGSNLVELNRMIVAGELVNRGGDLLSEPLTEALFTDDNRLVYPVLDGVPVLLEEACIDLASQSGG